MKVYKMKYENGKIIKGCVTGIESYGIFMSFDVNIGETIRVKIIDTDHEHCQLKLSIKDINDRINNKRRTKIVETGTGFYCLKENLDRWIEEKKQDK